MKTHTITLQVRSYELDSLGHLNNAVYMHYFEHARILFYRHIGFDLKEFFGSGRSMVLAESRVKFRKPAFIDESIKIKTILRVEKIRLNFEQTIRRGEDVIATALSTIVALDLKGRPDKPPADLLRLIGGE